MLNMSSLVSLSSIIHHKMTIIIQSWLLTSCRIMHFHQMWRLNTTDWHFSHFLQARTEIFPDVQVIIIVALNVIQMLFRYDFTFYDHDHESLYFRYKNSDELVMIIISDGACSDEKSQRWLQQTKKRIHQEQNCAVQQGELVAVINNETWASLQFFKWMQWWCRCGGWSFKAWKKESYSVYDEFYNPFKKDQLEQTLLLLLIFILLHQATD